MTGYAKCPNDCSGEVPIEIDSQASGFGDCPMTWGIDDEANATSHDDDCPPLTDEQRERIEAEFDIDDHLIAQAEAWAEIGAEAALAEAGL